MNYSKLIHEYLDFGLDPNSEQTLFSQLATDTEVRHDFNLQLRMHKATSEDNKFIAPPMAVTSQLFGNLGFSIPTAIIATSEASRPIATAIMSSIAIGVLNFVRDNYITMLSFIAGSAIASMFMFWIGIESPKNQNKNENKNTNLSNKLNPNSQLTFPISNSKEVENSSKANITYKHSKINNKSQDLVSTNSNIVLNSLDKGNALNNTTSLSQDLIKELKNSIANGGLNLVVENGKTNKDITDNSTIKQTNTRIDFSNSQNESLSLNRGAFDYKNMRFTRIVLAETPDNSVYMRSLSTNEANPGNSFGNLIVGGHHYFFDNVAFKVELGYEQYNLLKFKVESNKNETINESIAWFGVGASLNAREVWFVPYEIFPYFDFVLGGTTQGFIGRSQVGIEFVPESKIGIILGYEYVKMFYRDNQNYKSLDRNGISVGMKLSF